MAVFMVLFIREYTNKPIKSNAVIASLFIVPVVSAILVITNPYHNLYYNSFELVIGEHFSRLNLDVVFYKELHLCIYT